MDLQTTLSNLLGIPATRYELEPEKRGELGLDNVVAEKHLITAEPGSRLPLTLYRPRQTESPCPAVVLTCGHGDSKSVPHMQYVARTYAHAGVVCLLAGPLGEEERHHDGVIGSRAHDALDTVYRCEMAGRPVMGKFVFDSMRCLDFLETLDWVDGERLGVVGNSLGGAVAGWLFALEPRVRMAIVSGWGFSDELCRRSKHCTRVPNHKLRAVCSWPEFLQLGMPHGTLLVMNGDTDAVIDKDQSGRVWRDTLTHLQTADPAGESLHTWFRSAGGHRPYQGTKQALEFVRDHLGTPLFSADDIAALPEVNYGEWCDRHGTEIEKLYGTENHYRGARMPDFGLKPMPPDQLAVLNAEEIGNSDFTIDGWLKRWET